MNILPFRRPKHRPDAALQGHSGISVEKLYSSYGSTKVLDDVTCRIRPGGVTSIIGPNGAGKSTLLGIMSRLQDADSGRVVVNGQDVHDCDGRELARSLAVLRQENAFAIRLTVRELIGFGRFPHNGGRPAAGDAEHIERALELMELVPFADRYLDELSGGQRQRAFIAMVLAQDTEYILLDEPLNNLDLRHATSIMRLVRRIAEQDGRTVILVIHDINIAAAYSDRIIAMRDGQIIADGCPADIMTTETLRGIYDMDMPVTEVAGRRVALYFDSSVELEADAPSEAEIRLLLA